MTSKTERAQRRADRQAEQAAAYERGMGRVAAYIALRAKRDGGIWADKTIPYYRLMGDFWGAQFAPVKKPVPLDRREDFTAELATLRSFDADGYTAVNDLFEANDVARLLIENDFDTVDVELLGQRSEGEHELADYYRVFRVGDRKVTTRAFTIIDPSNLRSHAEGLREEAASLDALADLAGAAK